MIATLCFLLVLQALPPNNPSAEQAYADAVSEAALRTSVHDLVAFGPRMGGTPSGDKASTFLEQYFTRLGLKTEVFTDHLADLKQTPGWESKGTPDPVNLKIDYSLYYHSSGDTPENTTDREPQNMVKAVKVTGLALLRFTK